MASTSCTRITASPSVVPPVSSVVSAPDVGPCVSTPLIWPGCKDWIEGAVANDIPADASRLIDVFMGSGTVSLKLAERFPSVLMTDVNPDLVGFMRATLSDPEGLIAKASPLFVAGMNDGETYRRQRTLFNNGLGTRTPERFLYLNRHCYGGMIRYNKQGGFNTAAGNRKASVFPQESIRGMSKRLPHAVVELADFRVTMKKAGAGDFVVADPPYLDSTITYTAEGFGNKEHADLVRAAEAAAARGATVVIFNHDTPLARQLYANASEVVSLSVQRKLGKHEKVPELKAVYRPSVQTPAAAPAFTVVGNSTPAANDSESSAEGFNAFGVIERPAVACAYESSTAKASATLWAHPVGKTWATGFDLAFSCGDFGSATSLPSVRGVRAETKSKAVEQAVTALLGDLSARFPDLQALTKGQASEIRALREWLAEQLEKARAGGFEPQPAFTFIDLCAGVGGFHLGLSQAGGRCVLACEIDEHARQTYLANHSMEGVPFPADITHLSAQDVPDHDVLAAGFPCQAFSIGGKKAGFAEARGQIIFHLFRIIETKRPKVVLLENVKHFGSGEGGLWSRTLRQKLAGLGYAVSSKVFNAADFGTAQERERVFYVAYRLDAFPMVQRFSLPVGGGKWVSVADILEPNAPAGKHAASDITISPTLDKKSPLKRIGMLHGHRGQQARVYDPQGHATTLLAGQQSCGLYLVNGIPRQLTPRERARLQGFPDWFKPHPVKTHANKQFGNSVAVPVIRAFGTAFNQQFFNQTA